MKATNNSIALIKSLVHPLLKTQAGRALILGGFRAADASGDPAARWPLEELGELAIASTASDRADALLDMIGASIAALYADPSIDVAAAVAGAERSQRERGRAPWAGTAIARLIMKLATPDARASAQGIIAKKMPLGAVSDLTGRQIKSSHVSLALDPETGCVVVMAPGKDSCFVPAHYTVKAAVEAANAFLPTWVSPLTQYQRADKFVKDGPLTEPASWILLGPPAAGKTTKVAEQPDKYLDGDELIEGLQGWPAGGRDDPWWDKAVGPMISQSANAALAHSAMRDDHRGKVILTAFEPHPDLVKAVWLPPLEQHLANAEKRGDAKSSIMAARQYCERYATEFNKPVINVG